MEDMEDYMVLIKEEEKNHFQKWSTYNLHITLLNDL